MDGTLTYPEHYSAAAKSRAATFRALVRQAIEALLLGFYVCLIYKLQSVGIAILCLIIFLGVFIRLRILYLFTLAGILSVMYLAMSTLTAFLVSFHQGLYRTAQFVVTIAAFTITSNYIEHLDSNRTWAFANKFSCLNIAIFLHMIAYHLYHGYLTTWKYLYDTKTTISIVAVIIFLYEDSIRQKYGTRGWWLVLGGFGVLCLLSGERKAYLLTAILFVLSRASLFQKAATGLVAAAAILFYAVGAPPDSYVAKQLDSLFSEQQEVQEGDFYNNEQISGQSDLTREFVNQNARQLFLENPIMGLGANGYANEADQQFSDADRQIGLATNVHGEVNRVPVEGGLVGIFIASSYMLMLAIAVVKDFWRKGMFRSAAAERFPQYVFIFVFLYLYVEALDTLMLSLIVLFGFHVSKVSYSSSSARSAAGRRA
jgi:hypothetical protein